MKKLIYLASALMIFGLTSCNSEPGPEYTTPPTVSNLDIHPHIVKLDKDDAIEDVYENEPVTFSGYLTNQYGESYVYLIYRTMSDDEYAEYNNNESMLEQAWRDKFGKSDESKGVPTTYTSPVEDKYFIFEIEGLPAGTHVRWDFGFYNSYGLGAPGYLVYNMLPSALEREYVVKKAADLEPSSPQN